MTKIPVIGERFSVLGRCYAVCEDKGVDGRWCDGCAFHSEAGCVPPTRETGLKLTCRWFTRTDEKNVIFKATDQ